MLENKKEILAYGRERIKELYEELNNTDFGVQEVVYVNILSDQSKVSSSNRNEDISDVLLKQKNLPGTGICYDKITIFQLYL